jgi:cobalamin biosynthesis protein CobT
MDGVPKSGASRAFVNNVRLAIQAQMRTKIRPEQRTGRLNKRALIRPVLPPVDGGKWNAKIFYKKEDSKKINTAVTVLVDVSGSMSGTKLVYASQAACLLSNTLARALKVPTEILCFAYTWGKITIGEVKRFDLRMTG